MTKARGKTLAISPFRKLVIDLMHFSRLVPAATLDRRMNLAPLVAARAACSPRPMWTSLFIKAHALVAMRQPVLRQSYMSFPWPRLYQHPGNIAAINISRRIGDEDVVLQALIRSPENRSLPELDAIIRQYQQMPVEKLNTYRRARRVSHLPGPLRRFLMWATLNWIGRRRCHNFGTFGMSSVCDRGAGILNAVPIMTSMVHCGLLDAQGCLDVRFSIDHRVLDGAPAADALLDIEKTLLGEVLEEVKSLRCDHILPLPRIMAA